MINAFKTYAAVFGFLLDSSDIIRINKQKYTVPSGNRTFLKLISLLFILLPGLTAILIARLDTLFELSFTADMILYVVLYFTVSTLAGFITEKQVCQKRLKKMS